MPQKGYAGNQISSVHVWKFKGLTVWAGPDHFQTQENSGSMCIQEGHKLKFYPRSTLAHPIIKEVWLSDWWAGKRWDRHATEKQPEPPWGGSSGSRSGLSDTEPPGGWEALPPRGSSDWENGTVGAVLSYPGLQLFCCAYDVVIYGFYWVPGDNSRTNPMLKPLLGLYQVMCIKRAECIYKNRSVVIQFPPTEGCFQY